MGSVWSPSTDDLNAFHSACKHLGNFRLASTVAGADDPYGNESLMLDFVSGLEQWSDIAPMLSLEDVGAVAASTARINLAKIPASLQQKVMASVNKIADARKIALTRETEFSLRPNFSTIVALSVTAINGSDTATFQIKPPGVGTYNNNAFNIIQITSHTRLATVSLDSAIVDIRFNGVTLFQNEKGAAGSTLTGCPMAKFGLAAYQTQHRPLRPLSPDNNPIDNIAVTVTSSVVAEYLVCFDGVISRPYGGNCAGRAAPSVTMGGAAVLRLGR